GLESGIFFLYALVMNLWVYPWLILLTLSGILFFPLLFVLWKVLTRWESGRIMRLFIWCYGRAWLAINAPFVRFSREGFDTLKLPRPSILVINHLSFFDIYCMGLFPHSDVAFAVRSWPYKMFWYAPFMHLAQYLNLERIGWQGAFERGRKIFSQQGSLLFFPEGHRSRDGRLQRFYSGPFKLAVETGVPIVPLCISGTEVLLPAGRWWMRPAWIRLAVLPPVDPKGYEGPLGHIALKKQIKTQMAEKLSAMGRR
ncbi:MAG: lysophospholipid acyltransferase family protein, partial [Thermodesulfobacteriota bacterium]